MTKLTVAAIAGALLIQGCATVPEPVPTGPCKVTQQMHIRYAGMKYRERMRRGLERDANAPVSRILRADAGGTMDFRTERLNIHLGDDGRIDGLRCG
ncbi:hypothetical protein D9601_05745 [Sphingomonas sp. MA1305]|uniref:I78 family peptidase inhibitor n=1 Tax=unclassified Sphingomonas TaxID=196159 RepID=UPI0018DF950D|nr:I78 family peptidase inhibitor [Sphingomonas sp. MA1305]MBI0474863.1 hypothetical protein [Sphingomonas sp. MA1305]